VQAFGLQRTSELLLPIVERVHWYSLFDLPKTWTATTRHREAEGSAYYRHYYMGLIREDGTPKPAADGFPDGMGICQWFHFEDHRLDSGVEWLRKLGVKYLRTGISWADWFRPNSETWFDRQMSALGEFDTTMTLCFTPEHLGVAPHYTSPPKNPADFAEFAAWAVERYAPPAKRPTSPDSDRAEVGARP
jgi:beta-xylosidase